MMATLDDLEAQLRTSWDRVYDRATIEVYGDQLQSLGDPRGELIAIDLAIEDGGPTRALTRRREQLVDAWLGETLPHGSIQCGFIDVDATSADPAGQVKLAVEGPGSRFIRGISMVGPPKLLAKAIEIVAAAPRPSMVRLTLRQWSELAEPTIRGNLLAALLGVLPHLQMVELEGSQILSEFPHPRLPRLKLSGLDAIMSAMSGLVMPQLTSLDFALYSHLATMRELIPPNFFAKFVARAPALSHLDLSRNQLGFHDPDHLGGGGDLLLALRALALDDQVRTLKLPKTFAARDRQTLRKRFPNVEIS